MDWRAKWIYASEKAGDVCPVFRRVWQVDKPLLKAELYLTALGVYEARLNGSANLYWLPDGRFTGSGCNTRSMM